MLYQTALIQSMTVKVSAASLSRTKIIDLISKCDLCAATFLTLKSLQWSRFHTYIKTVANEIDEALKCQRFLT